MMKDLKFIHITKTAGTSIENTGISVGIEWGIFHKEYGWHHECFQNKPIELREKYDWFTVVRNPYDRIISEFHCKWARARYEEVTAKAIETMDKDLFNKILVNRIFRINPLGDHYSEQHKYLDGSAINVLKFENIEEEFNSLMRRYGIVLNLKIKENVSDKAFSVNDLHPQTLYLINKVYEKDFKTFGYQMVSCPTLF